MYNLRTDTYAATYDKLNIELGWNLESIKKNGLISFYYAFLKNRYSFDKASG